MKVVAYLTHPLTPVVASNFMERGDNVSNAVDWVRWASENIEWSISAPWLVHIMAGDDELHRPRALVDQLAQLVRCDVLVLAGGTLSSHMRVQHEFAKNRGMPIVDATILGRSPPPKGSRPPGPIRDWTSWLISIASLPIAPLVAR